MRHEPSNNSIPLPKLRACIQNNARAPKTTRVHPKLRACIQNFARASKTTRVHPKLSACIQNFTCIQNYAHASKTTHVHPKFRACIQDYVRASKTSRCIQDYDRLTASQRISYHHFVFYIYVFLIIVNPLVRLGDGSDCYAVIFFSVFIISMPSKVIEIAIPFTFSGVNMFFAVQRVILPTGA